MAGSGPDGAAVGLDIAGLDGEKDDFVGLDGVHDVLRRADPQQGEGAGVDLPEGTPLMPSHGKLRILPPEYFGALVPKGIPKLTTAVT